MRSRRQQILSAARQARGRVGPTRAVGGGGGGGGAPAGPSPTPWDSTAEGSAQILNRERADAQAGFAGDARYEEEQYGFGAGANNPYSQAAALQRRRDTAQRGAVNGAGLQLYSGSTVNHLQGAARGYDRNLKGLEAEYNRSRELRSRREQEADRAYEQGLGTIREGALERAANAPIQPAPVGGGGSAGPGSASGGSVHPRARSSGVGVGHPAPKPPPGYHVYKGANGQWWFAPNN